MWDSRAIESYESWVWLPPGAQFLFTWIIFRNSKYLLIKKTSKKIPLLNNTTGGLKKKKYLITYAKCCWLKFSKWLNSLGHVGISMDVREASRFKNGLYHSKSHLKLSPPSSDSTLLSDRIEYHYSNESYHWEYVKWLMHHGDHGPNHKNFQLNRRRSWSELFLKKKVLTSLKWSRITGYLHEKTIKPGVECWNFKKKKKKNKSKLFV